MLVYFCKFIDLDLRDVNLYSICLRCSFLEINLIHKVITLCEDTRLIQIKIKQKTFHNISYHVRTFVFLYLFSKFIQNLF